MTRRAPSSWLRPSAIHAIWFRETVEPCASGIGVVVKIHVAGVVKHHAQGGVDVTGPRPPEMIASSLPAGFHGGGSGHPLGVSARCMLATTVDRIHGINGTTPSAPPSFRLMSRLVNADVRRTLLRQRACMAPSGSPAKARNVIATRPLKADSIS